MAKKPTRKSSLNCINLRNQLYNSNIYSKSKEFTSKICCNDREKSPSQKKEITPKIVKIDRPLTPRPKSMVVDHPIIIRHPNDKYIDKTKTVNSVIKSTTPPPRVNNLRLEFKSPKKNQEEETFVFL